MAAPEPAAGDAEVVAGDLLMAVVRFGRALRARLGDRVMAGAGDFVLHLLDAGGPQRSTELAAAMGVDHSTVSRQVAALVDAGLVCSDADPADRRARRLSITAAGRATLAAAMAQRAAVLAPAVDGRQADVAELVRVLDGVTDDLSRPCSLNPCSMNPCALNPYALEEHP